MLISSGLLVQPDEGVSDLVVDRIGESTTIYREEPDYCNHGWSQTQVPARSENENRESTTGPPPREAALLRIARMNARDVRDGRAREASAARQLAHTKRTSCALAARPLVDRGAPLRATLAHVSDDGHASAPRDCAAGVAPPRATMGEAVRCETPLAGREELRDVGARRARRCHDGWSEFLGFGSGLPRAAREVFGPVCDAGPGFDRFRESCPMC
ncbi:protein EXECUTER 2 [Dorcoceras hygrometricum]|uniref:Protein EXECUTER 2 n=1 Tax=Dorcoceras hygrometricum TaxID=472368 RepID=A0A2Z7A9L5_9LAMI|nr:protein EXECUTER 2 [Dorcoceras hygrometricum]